jgi:hypothetical protein
VPSEELALVSLRFDWLVLVDCWTFVVKGLRASVENCVESLAWCELELRGPGYQMKFALPFV